MLFYYNMRMSASSYWLMSDLWPMTLRHYMLTFNYLYSYDWSRIA